MNFIFKRVLDSIPLLFGITFLSFALMHLSPGDPSDMFITPKMSVEDIDQLKKNLGLDKPLITQYGYWLKGILRGDFGYSYTYARPVLDVILERLPATLLLSCSALVLILLITLPLGIVSGAKKDSIWDHVVMIGSFIGMSLPTFWLGLMLILLFSLKLNLFPTSGFLDPSLATASLFKKAGNIFHHMALPLATIVIGDIASLTRYHRFGIIGILSQDYILAAKARGLSEYRLLFKHAFKNAALPLVTILGLSLPSLIAGSFVIEYIFSWPGLGQMGLAAVFARDYPVLMGTLLFSSILIIFGNLLADLSYSMIDPRIKKSG